jgi:hypothetical protein
MQFPRLAARFYRPAAISGCSAAVFQCLCAHQLTQNEQGHRLLGFFLVSWSSAPRAGVLRRAVSSLGSLPKAAPPLLLQHRRNSRAVHFGSGSRMRIAKPSRRPYHLASPNCGLTLQSTGRYTACQYLARHFILGQILSIRSAPVTSNVRPQEGSRYRLNAPCSDRTRQHPTSIP